jgi:tetratricopeptide (TPR) repeat protein
MQTNTIQNSLNRARLLLEEGRSPEALTVLETIASKTEGQQPDVAYLLSWYYVLSKKWREAHQQLLPLLRPLQIETIEQEGTVERERAAMYRLRLGQVAVSLAHYEDASRHFLACLKILQERRIQRPALRIEIQYNLAMTYKMRGSYALAIRNYEESLRLTRHHRVFDAVPNIYYGLSEAYRCLGNFTKAHEAARKALHLYQEKGDEPLEARMYNILGKILLSLGDYNASEDYYDKSLVLATRNNRTIMILLDCAALAELFLEQEQMSKAIDYAHRALDVAEQVEDAYMRGIVYTTLGKVTQVEAHLAENTARQSKLHEAISWFEKARNEFQSRQLSVNLVDVYGRLASIYEELGDTNKAIEYWKFAYSEKDNAKSMSYVNV